MKAESAAFEMSKAHLKQNRCFWFTRCCPPSKLKDFMVPDCWKKYCVQPFGARLE